MYHYKRDAPQPYYNCVFPTFLDEKQVVEGLPFTDPDKKVQDEMWLHDYMPRVLNALNGYKNRKNIVPDKSPYDILYNLVDFRDGEENMRLIVTNFELLMTHPKFFIIGFFSKLRATISNSVLDKIWAIDDKLISSLVRFPSILGYFTCKKPNGEFFNYVFLENEAAVAKWRAFTYHNAAVAISPNYYEWVRINHAVLPCSLESMYEVPGAEKQMEIIRTKYFYFEDGECTFRGVRKYKPDSLFYSLPEHQRNAPYVFASFLGCNAFSFYKTLVDYIGKTTGLPVKMIDIADLTKNVHPRPDDMDSIHKYNIDFAFTCGLSYVKFFPNFVPLAAPVRTDERYKGKPVYFADIIVNSASRFKTIEDLKGAKFSINEEISYSGCKLPEYYFRENGGLSGHFSEIVRSGSHANSMNLVRDLEADAAGIDSVVLEMEFNQRPERRKEFRVLGTTQACTMPPFVAASWVHHKAQRTIQKALLNAYKDPNIQQIMHENGFANFVKVADTQYNDIREVITFVDEMNNKNGSTPATPVAAPAGYGCPSMGAWPTRATTSASNEAVTAMKSRYRVTPATIIVPTPAATTTATTTATTAAQAAVTAAVATATHSATATGCPFHHMHGQNFQHHAH